MKKLIIDESKWLRGPLAYDGDGEVNTSCLLRSSDGLMCCLGFLAKELGYDDAAIVQKGELTEVLPLDESVEIGLVDADDEGTSDFTQVCIIEINDDRTISDKERKAKLVPIFAKLGWELEFVPGVEREESNG